MCSSDPDVPAEGNKAKWMSSNGGFGGDSATIGTYYTLAEAALAYAR